MDFMGVGPAELLVILVLILVVVGPRRLPQMAAEVARFIRTARKLSAQVTHEFTETMSDLEKEYDDMRGEWKDVGQGLDEGAKAVGQELQAADRDASGALQESTKPPERSIS